MWNAETFAKEADDEFLTIVEDVRGVGRNILVHPFNRGMYNFDHGVGPIYHYCLSTHGTDQPGCEGL